MKSPAEFFAQTEPYLSLYNEFVTKHSLQEKILPDHICYKCGSRESFESLRTVFEHESDYIYQSIISGRSIAVIRFKNGIETSHGRIMFLELSDQKPDGSQKEGFDHVEAYPTGWSYDDMVRVLEKSERVIKVERPHHTTHDIDIGGGFLFRCTRGPLIEKIKREEMK